MFATRSGGNYFYSGLAKTVIAAREIADYYREMTISHNTQNLLKKARQLLTMQETMGISGVPLTPEIARFLNGPPPTPPQIARGLPRTVRPPRAGQAAALFTPAPESALNLPLAEIHQEIAECSKCPLHKGCKQIVPGRGPAGARLFIIEDQPTAAEEEAGHPFAGETGELFDKMMKAIGLERSAVYLTSIVKCRPLADKEPNPEEIRSCLTYLARQIAAVNPVVICTMGPLAGRVLTGNSQSLFRYRGKFHDFHGTPLLPSFHPRFLLNNSEMKKGSWADLQLLQKKIC
jgi:DNA polymerase